MKWQAWVLTIVASLIVAGIGAVATATLGSARTAAATEERVHQVERRVGEQDARLDELSAGQLLLERIDERVGDMVRRLDRVERKLDEPARARR